MPRDVEGGRIMKIKTIHDMKQHMISFLQNLIKELQQPELIDNSMLECGVDTTRDITKTDHKLCKKKIILWFRYAKDEILKGDNNGF